MASSDHSTAALVSALTALLDRWRADALPDVDAAPLVARKNAKLSRTCRCDQGVCCYASIHPVAVHVAPHQHCILRMHGEQPVVARTISAVTV